MGTLSSELAPHAERLSPRPRIYADANVPAGLVAYMRARLNWDVVFVLEEDVLRRASDVKHYRLAQQLRRTLVTLDRDYLDDRRFPPAEGAGVLVISGPNERELAALLARVDAALFQRSPDASDAPDECDEGDEAAHATPLPLEGRKLLVHTDWGREN